jgi:hypothetical protein
MTFVFEQIKDAFSHAPLAMLQLMGLWGVDKAFNLIFSAIGARVAMSSIKRMALK